MMFVRVLRALGLWPSFLALVFIVVKSDGISDNEVKNTVLLFQDVALSDWNEANKTAVLQRVIVDAVNAFCSSYPNKCSLNFWNESRKFNSRHVIVVESPKQEEKDILVKVFVSLPDGKDIRKDSHSAIAGSVFKEILLSHKYNLSFAVGAEVKSIDIENQSSDNTSDNKMNYIMIPITFAVLVVLCCMAFCLHSASKSRQKVIEKERRKQMKLNKLQPSTANDVEAQNTAGAEIQTAVLEKTRKQRKRHQQKHDESVDLTRKKKKVKHGKHRRLQEETACEPAMLGGHLGRGERERVPTPIPEHHAVNMDGQKHTRKKKQKKTQRELREHDEGYSEGSETRQQAAELNSEELLIKSLPRPRQLAPLPERTDIHL